MSIQPGSSKLAGRHSVPEIQKKQKSQIKKILLQLLNYQGALSVGYHRQYSFYRRRLFTAYYDTIRNFDKLPHKNKVIFTNVEYPEFQSAYYIRGFEEQSQLGVLVDYKKQFLLRRYLDDFDYVDFLNGL